jgi:hypothetical protein
MPDSRALTPAANGRLREGPENARRGMKPRRTHGILSAEVVIEALGESGEELARLRRRLWEELAPVGLVEEMLAERILVGYWRLRRVLIAEGRLLAQRAEDAAERIVAARRSIAARGPAPAPEGAAGTGDEAAALTADELALFAAAQLLGAAEAERLGRYETMLERQLHRSIKELTQFQARRVALLIGRGAPPG